MCSKVECLAPLPGRSTQYHFNFSIPSLPARLRSHPPCWICAQSPWQRCSRCACFTPPRSSCSHPPTPATHLDRFVHGACGDDAVVVLAPIGSQHFVLMGRKRQAGARLPHVPDLEGIGVNADQLGGSTKRPGPLPTSPANNDKRPG